MDWNIILKDIYNSKEYKILIKKIKEEYKTKTIYPSFNNVFKALELTPYKNVKAVIIGQDPYHGEGEANGLCFSVNKDIKQPPSLRNIFKELKSDLNIEATSNDLSSWAKEGVLLLNSCLTVIKDKPNSHKDIGWQFFTDNIISKLNERKEPIVFILWGNYAKTKKKLKSLNNRKFTPITPRSL